MLSTVDRHFWWPLDLPASDRLFTMQLQLEDGTFSPQSHPEYTQVRELGDDAFSLACFGQFDFTMVAGGAPARVVVALVSGNFFTVLGPRPAHGRLLTPLDDGPSGAPVVVVSHRAWTTHFGQDPGIVGRTVRLGSQVFTVVGVVANPLPGPAHDPDFWAPLSAVARLLPDSADALLAPAARWLSTVGRLHPPASRRDAAARTALARDRLPPDAAATRPDDWRFVALPVGYARLGPAYHRDATRFLTILVLITGVFLVAVSSNMVLAAADARRRADARVGRAARAGRVAAAARPSVRDRAARARRRRRAGGSPGAAVAWSPRVGTAATGAPGPDGRLRRRRRALDAGRGGRGLGHRLPGVAGPDGHPAAGAPEGGRPGADGSRHAPAGAGGHAGRAVLRTAGRRGTPVAQRRRRRGGFRAGSPRGTFSSHRLHTADATGTDGYAFYRRLLDELENRGVVSSAAVAWHAPLSAFTLSVSVEVPGVALDVLGNAVSRDYFRTLGVALIEGREFIATDHGDSLPVAIVNRTLAERLWPGRSAVGRILTFPRSGGDRTVVGVVDDMRYRTLTEPAQPLAYLPLAQRVFSPAFLYARSSADPAITLQHLRQLTAALDPGVPLSDIHALSDRVDDALNRWRAPAQLAGILALVTLALTMGGLYGVVTLSVSQRTRELALRVALGARETAVRRMVLAQGLRLVAAGALLGLAAAVPLLMLLASQLYGVAPHDVPTVAASVLALFGAGGLACDLPARRAARLDVAAALRTE